MKHEHATAIQPFSSLDADTEKALRASIKRFGVVVPIVVDGMGRILDGHHRSRIAMELNLPCPQIKRAVKDDDDANALAYTLNADRRQMTVEQRREVVADLRRQGYSLRAIAGVVGVSKSQVANDLEQVSTTGHLEAASGSGESDASGSDAAGSGDDETGTAAASPSPAPNPALPEGVDPETGEVVPHGKVRGLDNKLHPASKPKQPAPDPIADEIGRSALGYRAAVTAELTKLRGGLLLLSAERIHETADDETAGHLLRAIEDTRKWCDEVEAGLRRRNLKVVGK